MLATTSGTTNDHQPPPNQVSSTRGNPTVLPAIFSLRQGVADDAAPPMLLRDRVADDMGDSCVSERQHKRARKGRRVEVMGSGDVSDQDQLGEQVLALQAGVEGWQDTASKLYACLATHLQTAESTTSPNRSDE
eukprot:m.149655 g.149655  ORF g.149655 m.149655 type:complete len:134 (-) comp17352_c0_seq3:43-444(-)